MTTARDTLIAAGVLLVLTLIVAAVAFAAIGLPVLAIDWILTTGLPAAQAWLADNPNERDVLTIGVLALLALALAEWRRK